MNSLTEWPRVMRQPDAVHKHRLALLPSHVPDHPQLREQRPGDDYNIINIGSSYHRILRRYTINILHAEQIGSRSEDLGHVGPKLKLDFTCVALDLKLYLYNNGFIITWMLHQIIMYSIKMKHVVDNITMNNNFIRRQYEKIFRKLRGHAFLLKYNKLDLIQGSKGIRQWPMVHPH